MADPIDHKETDVEITYRLQRAWEIWGADHRNSLMQKLLRLQSGGAIILSGIDRDVLLYALAMTTPAVTDTEHASKEG